MSIVRCLMVRTADRTAVPYSDAGKTIAKAEQALFEHLAETETGSAWGRLRQAEELAQKGKVDASLDVVFALFDELLRNGDLRTADMFLHFWDAGLDPDVTVGALMATFPARDQLRHRAGLVSRLERVLLGVESPEEAERTLRHLR